MPDSSDPQGQEARLVDKENRGANEPRHPLINGPTKRAVGSLPQPRAPALPASPSELRLADAQSEAAELRERLQASAAGAAALVQRVAACEGDLVLVCARLDDEEAAAASAARERRLAVEADALRRAAAAAERSQAEERERLAMEAAQARLMARARARQVADAEARAAAAVAAAEAAQRASQEAAAARHAAEVRATVATDAAAAEVAAAAAARGAAERRAAAAEAGAAAAERAAAAADAAAADARAHAAWQDARIAELQAQDSAQAAARYDRELAAAQAAAAAALEAERGQRLEAERELARMRDGSDPREGLSAGRRGNAWATALGLAYSFEAEGPQRADAAAQTEADAATSAPSGTAAALVSAARAPGGSAGGPMRGSEEDAHSLQASLRASRERCKRTEDSLRAELAQAREAATEGGRAQADALAAARADADAARQQALAARDALAAAAAAHAAELQRLRLEVEDDAAVAMLEGSAAGAHAAQRVTELERQLETAREALAEARARADAEATHARPGDDDICRVLSTTATPASSCATAAAAPPSAGGSSHRALTRRPPQPATALTPQRWQGPAGGASPLRPRSHASPSALLGARSDPGAYEKRIDGNRRREDASGIAARLEAKLREAEARREGASGRARGPDRTLEGYDEGGRRGSGMGRELLRDISPLRAFRSGPASTVQILDGAEVLQQQAERKRGAEAVPAYERAAAAFQRAIDAEQAQALPSERHLDACLGLGECLQGWADALAAATAALPDAQLTEAAEASARVDTQRLYERALQAYQQVRAGDGRVHADAAVNSGNALAAAAEAERASGGGRAGAMLAEAAQAYRAALEQEEDALTWSNLADTLVAAAELDAESAAAHAAVHMSDAAVAPAAGWRRKANGTPACQDNAGVAAEAAKEQSRRLYAEAMAAYAAACSLSSSEAGDDLPALLFNWGVGLHSLGTHAQAPEEAEAALVEAGARLREAASFAKGDPAPLVAAGEALVARAERRVAAAAAAMQAGEAARLLAEAGALYAEALETGYHDALRLDGGCADARVGAAEAHIALGKLVAAESRPQAAQHLAAAVAEYRVALRRPEALGGLADRSSVCPRAMLP
ncbi:hypothetical protein WJX81_003740 [Elliptochloris bilobata]|uniref:Uncharacterized protein n=1 Tax=Elliptochloris bilobata TaxID=381761 RepID=A0AAW1RXK1_9CHLO